MVKKGIPLGPPVETRFHQISNRVEFDPSSATSILINNTARPRIFNPVNQRVSGTALNVIFQTNSVFFFRFFRLFWVVSHLISIPLCWMPFSMTSFPFSTFNNFLGICFTLQHHWLDRRDKRRDENERKRNMITFDWFGSITHTEDPQFTKQPIELSSVAKLIMKFIKQRLQLSQSILDRRWKPWSTLQWTLSPLPFHSRIIFLGRLLKPFEPFNITIDDNRLFANKLKWPIWHSNRLPMPKRFIFLNVKFTDNYLSPQIYWIQKRKATRSTCQIQFQLGNRNQLKCLFDDRYNNNIHENGH